MKKKIIVKGRKKGEYTTIKIHKDATKEEVQPLFDNFIRQLKK